MYATDWKMSYDMEASSGFILLSDDDGNNIVKNCQLHP